MPAQLVVQRQAALWSDRLRRYKVVVDGQIVGAVKNGEVKRFALPVGEHAIQFSIDWCSSEVLHVRLREGQEQTIWCGPSMPAVLAIVRLFRPSKWVSVRLA